MDWQESDRCSKYSMVESSFDQQQKCEQAQVIPIVNFTQLVPANEIIRDKIKGDEIVKVIIHNICRTHRQIVQPSQPSSLEHQTLLKPGLALKDHFGEKDSLAFHFQAHFQKNLVYARLFEGLDLKDWMKMITYVPPVGNSKQKSSWSTKKIKFLAGLFRTGQAEGSNKIGREKIQNIERPHLLSNNLCLCHQPCIEKNYRPEIISFSASHQSANLMFAFCTNPNEFSLVIHNDTNSRGTTQWFSFTVLLPQSHNFENIKFNVTNLVINPITQTKTCPSFIKGMAVVYKYQTDSTWRRLPTDSCYYPNDIAREGRKGVNYNSLTFFYSTKLNPEKAGCAVSFAYGYPYDLQDSHIFWSSFQKPLLVRKKKKQMITAELILQSQVIGKSVSGISILAHKIYFQSNHRSLHILKNSKSTKKIQKKSQKKSIIILARQHPGETQGSFISEGIVNFLTGDQLSHKGKRKFIYHIIPMINPDGVLVGNYRTNLKGHDLNRNWRNPSVEAQPEIVSVKKYLSLVDRQSEICLILDLHGHSKALNSFFYGVETASKLYESPKLFPYFCSKRIDKISYAQSEFTLGENKKNTARAVLSQLFPRALVYTLETSFYGYEVQEGKNRKIFEFHPDELRKLGQQLILAYLEYTQLPESMGPESKVQNQVKTNWQHNAQSKQSLGKEIEQIQRRDKQNYPSVTGQHESDSGEELTDNQQAIQDKQTYKEKEKQVKLFPHNQNSARFQIQGRLRKRRGDIENKGLKCQGNYLKAIELIDMTNFDMRNSVLSMQDRQGNAQTIYKPIQKTERIPSERKQTERKGKIVHSIPLLGICAFKKSGIESQSVRKIHAMPRLTNRSRCGQNIRWVNQKQVAFEEISRKRVEGWNASKNNSRVNNSTFHNE